MLPIGRFLTFEASANTSTQLDVERLIDGVRNPVPGVPDGAPPGLDGILRDTPTRNTTFGATLTGGFDSTTISLNARYQKVEPGVENVSTDQETARLSLSLQQRIARYFAIDASGSYTLRRFRQTR